MKSAQFSYFADHLSGRLKINPLIITQISLWSHRSPRITIDPEFILELYKHSLIIIKLGIDHFQVSHAFHLFAYCDFLTMNFPANMQLQIKEAGPSIKHCSPSVIINITNILIRYWPNTDRLGFQLKELAQLKHLFQLLSICKQS